MNLAITGNRSAAGTLGKLSSRHGSRTQKRKTSASAKKTNARLDWKENIKFLFNCFMKALVIVIFGAGCFAGYNLFMESPYFKVDRVHFSGQGGIDKSELLELTGPIEGENILMLNLGQVSEQLASHPWIKRVSAQRAFPQSVQITIERRIPFVRIQLEKVYVMDNFGVLLQEDAPAFKNLPIVSGLSYKDAAPGDNVATEEMILGLKTMDYFNRHPYFEGNPIVKASLQGNNQIRFISKNENVAVAAALDSMSESLQKFMIVLDTMDDGGKDVEWFDLSFTNRVIVKHRTDPAAPGPTS
ncbi:MAG: FtsQ-type POTRA domain-containing protein [Candidatus Nitrohelix vancouverensis]|uniref:FtsQ-type POTRA domain-containing protein n=1 Tax=Candidatus Nitrohelix vancouverensis TaxID=2705534 RepID=A0A7T0G4M3_9BACT|nr:MAG: FtsQ-type POTRA domain-containing protein [Candidatus Nitrohelix vancouverensis]